MYYNSWLCEETPLGLLPPGVTMKTTSIQTPLYRSFIYILTCTHTCTQIGIHYWYVCIVRASNFILRAGTQSTWLMVPNIWHYLRLRRGHSTQKNSSHLLIYTPSFSSWHIQSNDSVCLEKHVRFFFLFFFREARVKSTGRTGRASFLCFFARVFSVLIKSKI